MILRVFFFFNNTSDVANWPSIDLHCFIEADKLISMSNCMSGLSFGNIQSNYETLCSSFFFCWRHFACSYAFQDASLSLCLSSPKPPLPAQHLRFCLPVIWEVFFHTFAVFICSCLPSYVFNFTHKHWMLQTVVIYLNCLGCSFALDVMAGHLHHHYRFSRMAPLPHIPSKRRAGRLKRAGFNVIHKVIPVFVCAWDKYFYEGR